MDWKRLFDRIDSFFTVWNFCKVAWAAVSFGSFAWAAAASEWLDGYGPIAWLTAGVLGVLISTLVLGVVARVAFWIKGRLLLHSMAAQFYRDGPSVNPVDLHFFTKRIFLKDLLPPGEIEVRGKTFENFELIGPLNIYMVNCRTERNSFVGVDHIIVSADSVQNWRIRNARVFRDCSFLNCRIYSVSFLINEQAYRVAQGWGGTNWITYTPDAPAPAGGNPPPVMPAEDNR